jgi:hypothetical protein
MSMDAKIEKTSGQTENADTPKKILMPDIYADGATSEEAAPETIDSPTPEVGESIGFNPYDTGALQKK